MKHGDLLFGTIGTGSSLGLAHINLALGISAGVVTLCVMILRLRREWNHRDKPPEE